MPRTGKQLLQIVVDLHQQTPKEHDLFRAHSPEDQTAHLLCHLLYILYAGFALLRQGKPHDPLIGFIRFSRDIPLPLHPGSVKRISRIWEIPLRNFHEKRRNTTIPTGALKMQRSDYKIIPSLPEI